MRIKSKKSVGRKPVYDITVRDAEHYVLENGVVTHNTGIYYSASTIIFFGRSQEKDDGDLSGFNFTMKIDKSRKVVEQSKIPLNVTFKGGINKMSGMFELALEGGFLIKPKNGWYQIVNKETGEVSTKSYRAAEVDSSGELEKIVYSDSFKKYVRERYNLGYQINGGDVEEKIADIEDEFEGEDDLE